MDRSEPIVKRNFGPSSALLFSILTLSLSVVANLGLTTSAAAHEQGYAFAYADQPTATFYSPAEFRSYNDGGGVIEITRQTTGSYSVFFDGIEDLSSHGGNVQVTSADPETHYCNSDGWNANQASVNCFNIAGIADDARFNILYLRPDDHANDYGIAWVNDSTSSTSTPPGTWLYNGGTSLGTTVTRYRTGHYAIRWEGLDAIGDGPRIDLVTAFSSNARCQIDSPLPDGFNVRCHGPAGIARDSRFNALSMRTEDTTDGLGFARADSPFSNSYVILPNDAYNSSGAGDVTSTRIGTGEYRISWDGLDSVGINLGSLQISADSFYDRLCGVASSDADSVTVRCVDSLGNSADSAFHALFVKPPKKVWANRYGYVRADMPTTSSYSLDDEYSANPLNSTSTIFRTTTGTYQFEATGFEEWGNYGHLQVSSSDASNRSCQVRTWYDEVGEVACYSFNGALTDTQFNALYIKPDTDLSSVAYAYANSPTISNYIPQPQESWNPGGGVITASRSSTGVYSISFAGLQSVGFGGGNVQVSARSTFPTTCQVASWGSNLANVRCFSLVSGAPRDSAYAIMFTKPEPNHAALAFAYMSDPTSTNSTPPSNFAFNSGGGTVSASRAIAGIYTLNFPGFSEQGLDRGTVLITAHGSTARVCNPSFWSGGLVSIRCYDPAGNLADSRFSALWIKETNNTRIGENYAAVPEPAFASAIAIGLLWISFARVSQLRRKKA
ncbi:MAG: hypothetical protein AB8G23_05940 [Myxococcota bacterium]